MLLPSHSTDGREGERGKKTGVSVYVCVCVCAYRYNSQSVEPNVPPIKVYLDQVVTGFCGSEGRLVGPGMSWVWWWLWAPRVAGLSIPPPPVMVVTAAAAPLLDVVGEPAESFAVALPLQHAAHEHLQWSCVQLLHGNGALRVKHRGSVRTGLTQGRGWVSAALSHLSCRLAVQSKHFPQPLLADGLWSVDLVAQDEDRHVSDGLICH